MAASTGDADPIALVVVGMLFVAVGVWILRPFVLARRYVDVEATVVDRRRGWRKGGGFWWLTLGVRTEAGAVDETTIKAWSKPPPPCSVISSVRVLASGRTVWLDDSAQRALGILCCLFGLFCILGGLTLMVGELIR